MRKNLLLIAAMATAFAANAQDSPVKEAAKTEIWTPVPKIVTPGNTNSEPPSDAVVIFNGKDVDQLQKENGGAVGWKIDGDALTVVKGSGNIATKQSFGNCQLHIEWREPSAIAGSSQTRGNSGIFFMGKYELQVLDSYNNPTYVNGQAGSIYKQHIPLVNASKKPGEWQTYDVIFTAPKFNSDGSVQSPARITVLLNNIVVQNNVEIKEIQNGWANPNTQSSAIKNPSYYRITEKMAGNR
jgi:hypothetical protein